MTALKVLNLRISDFNCVDILLHPLNILSFSRYLTSPERQLRCYFISSLTSKVSNFTAFAFVDVPKLFSEHENNVDKNKTADTNLDVILPISYNVSH